MRGRLIRLTDERTWLKARKRQAWLSFTDLGISTSDVTEWRRARRGELLGMSERGETWWYKRQRGRLAKGIPARDLLAMVDELDQAEKELAEYLTARRERRARKKAEA